MDARPGHRINLLGRAIDLVTQDQVLSFIETSIRVRRRSIVANHNAHSLYLVGRYPEMEAFYHRVDLIEADSMPLILWGKLMGRPISRKHQCTYLNWREDFWILADRCGWRIFYLGGEGEVAERAAKTLGAQYPGARIKVHSGFFDMTAGSPQNEAVVADINAFSPDILFVGMGMPRQEIWIERNHDRLKVAVTLPVGAAFDYEAGAQRAAPRWLGRIGLEWLFRFAVDPVRLFRRYFVEPWCLIPEALKDVALQASTLRSAIRTPRTAASASLRGDAYAARRRP